MELSNTNNLLVISAEDSSVFYNFIGLTLRL